MMVNELSPYWSCSRNFFTNRRMRHQSIGIYERRPPLACKKERQQRVARQAGRIGYIGNQGPASGTSTMPSTEKGSWRASWREVSFASARKGGAILRN